MDILFPDWGTSPHTLRCQWTNRRSRIHCQAFSYTVYRYRTYHRSFRNICSGTDGQRIFRPERQRGHCHRKCGR